MLVPIVGIRNGNGGRNCRSHRICGNVLRVDDKVQFTMIKIPVRSRTEPACAVVLISARSIPCRVGFVPKSSRELWSALNGKSGSVCKIIGDESSKEERREAYKVHGMAFIEVDFTHEVETI